MAHRSKKRERTQNWSTEEKLLLLKLCEPRLDILESKRGDQISIGKKSNAWKEIRTDFVSTLGIERDVSRLKEQWQRMKCQARADLQDFAMRVKRLGPLTACQKRPSQMSIEVWRLMETARKHFLLMSGSEFEEDTCTKEINWSISETFLLENPNSPEIDTVPSLLCETEVNGNCEDKENNVCFIYDYSEPISLKVAQQQPDNSEPSSVEDSRSKINCKETDNESDNYIKTENDIPSSMELFFSTWHLEQQKRLQLIEEHLKISKIYRETAEIQKQIAQQQLNHYNYKDRNNKSKHVHYPDDEIDDENRKRLRELK